MWFPVSLEDLKTWLSVTELLKVWVDGKLNLNQISLTCQRLPVKLLLCRSLLDTDAISFKVRQRCRHFSSRSCCLACRGQRRDEEQIGGYLECLSSTIRCIRMFSDPPVYAPRCDQASSRAHCALHFCPRVSWRGSFAGLNAHLKHLNSHTFTSVPVAGDSKINVTGSVTLKNNLLYYW